MAYVAIPLESNVTSSIQELAESIRNTARGQSLTELSPSAAACGEVSVANKYDGYSYTFSVGGKFVVGRLQSLSAQTGC